MSELKYRDRRKIIQYDLSTKLFKTLNINIKEIIPSNSYYIVRTDEGDKILKKLEYSCDEINFIFDGIKYVRRNFERLSDGKYFFYKDDIYCLMDFISGRECELLKVEDMELTVKALSEFSKASEGFKFALRKRNNCGALIDTLQRKKGEMEFFRSIAKIYEDRNEFDNIFLNNYDYNHDRINESIDRIKKSSYYKICSEENKVSLCINDFSSHNIIINDAGANFLSFEKATIDLKVIDLCSLIRSITNSSNFNIDNINLLLQNYTETNALDVREKEILKGCIIFPEEFYEISRDYYTRRKKWDEETFVFRLNKRISTNENGVKAISLMD